MLLIYGKNKVGSAVADLCTYLGLDYEMRDDSDGEIEFAQYEQIIPSPGVPCTHPVYQTEKVISELDFTYRYLPRGFKIVSITGTDGKSTTSWIIYNILQKEYLGKKKVYLSGNFDIPFSATALDILRSGEQKGIIVVEVSSFMSYALRGIDHGGYTSDYSIFTNIKPDHLNWHRDLMEYVDAKMNLMRNTRKKVIMNHQIIEFIQKYQINIEVPENMRFFAQSISGVEKIRDRTDGEKVIISGTKKYLLSETQFSGMHNAMNILSCAIVASEMKICSKRVRRYISEISGLPHRLEKIGEKNGIIFIEDSKSTSSQSLEAALGSYAPVNNEQGTMNSMKNLLLIVGGSDKGDTFDYLASRFQERVKAMVCIGATKDRFIQIAEQESIPYLITDNLSEGVNWLYLRGIPGDALMLSPGCASFGLFKDYLDRAHQFRNSIKNLPE